MQAIEYERKQILLEQGVTPNGVLRMIADIAKFDISEVFDENGRIREVSEMSPVARRVVAGIDTLTIRTKDGKSFSTTAKIKLPDRLRALELLAKHFSLLTDNVKVSGDAINPFELIVRQAQGNALVPVTQRDEDDSANALDDERVIDGEVIVKSDTPSDDMASGSALAAFNSISEDDSDDDDDINTEAPAVAQTKEDVERAVPQSERAAFKPLWKRRRRNL